MSDLNAAAAAAGLSKDKRKDIERLSKAMESHRALLNLPTTVASQAYTTKLTANEQQDLKNKFGEESPEEKPNRGWLGTAWHYTGGKVFEAAQALSDLSTRVARTGIIALEEGRNFADAWDRSEKDGQKVFNEDRLKTAEEKFGKTLIGVAKKIRTAKNADQVAELMATATEEEKYWLQISDRTIKNLNGADSNKLRADRDLLDDAISAVNAAQYSPGRFAANIIDAFTPGDFYKSGFFYKITSGAVDAAYRVFADPTLLLGKAKRLYDVNKYAYEVILASARKGGDDAARYFAKPQTQDFWNTYGAELTKLREATKAGNKEAAAKARAVATRIAPEFGPAVINLFNKAEISDVKSAQAFFENSEDAFKIMSAGTARKRILMPRLDNARKIRINTLTATNKVFNLDDIGPSLVNDFFGYPETQDGIYKAITEDPKKLIEAAQGLKVKGVDRLRFSSADMARRIDNAKRKFTRIPLFKDDTFDVMAADAPDKIFQLAAIVLPSRQARLVAETFGGVEEVGKRKEMFYGLYATIADIRGMNMTVDGQKIVRRMTGKGQVKFSIAGTDDYIDFGLLPSEMNDFVTAPSLLDIDRASSRIGLTQRILGISNSRFMEDVTNAWSFLTLAGPRYALRNSIEDLMVNIAIGSSPWGIAKNRYLATRLNTAIQLAPGLTTAEKVASSPLGIIMRFANKSEAEKYSAKIANYDKVIAENRAKIDELSKVVKNSKDKKKVKAAQDNIRRIRREMEGGLEKEVRTVLAEALSAGRAQRFARQLGIKALDDEGLELLTEQVLYGDVQNLLATLSEGGFNFASGANYIDSAFDTAKALGVKQAELRLDLNGLKTQYAKAAGARGFTEIGLTPNNEASMIAWALRISFYGNDELGSIALANLSDDAAESAKTIKALRDWITDPKNKKVLDDARLSSGKDLSPDEYAQIVYNRAKAILTRRDTGKINTELLDKIRTYDAELDRFVVSGKLTMDDLPDDINATPASVVGPELVPVADVNNYTSPLMQKGWVWLGLSTARLSRQPMALYEVTRVRKIMRETGFEEAYLNAFVNGIEDADAKAAALINARKELARLAEERAISQVLPYVDNPLIRSQVSFTARNFARFYRAQEDFYRRMGRIVRYNPEALQKLALTFDGVAHSGWVQEDDRGEKYFVYPHFAPGYRAMQGVLTALGIPQDFKVPFPVQFGASVKMLSPSLNTESWLPTFSGPAAALPMTVIENMVNVFEPGMGDTISRYTLGEYSVGQGLVSRLMPAHVNRALDAMSQDERNSQYASAYRKAVTYLEASGNGIPKRYDEEGNLIPPSSGELEAYREKVRSTTLAVLATRFVFGFLAPASPSIQLKSDMQEWIRDAGQANWKQSFNALREQYDGDYDKAMTKWVELFPNQVPYTVTESERKTIAFFGYAEESGKFVEDNEAMFKEFPEAAAFLIPHKGAFSFDAYRTMATMGLRKNKRVEDYLREVQTASDLQAYYSKRNEYEESLKFSGSDFARSLAREEFNTWKDRFFAGRPLVAEELNQGAEKRIKTLQALTDLQNFLDEPKYANIRPDTRRVLREMNQAYVDYKSQREIFELTGGNRELIATIKESTLQQIKELSLYNENTQAAFDVLFGRLLDS
jgi:hypothetical protein